MLSNEHAADQPDPQKEQIGNRETAAGQDYSKTFEKLAESMPEQSKAMLEARGDLPALEVRHLNPHLARERWMKLTIDTRHSLALKEHIGADRIEGLISENGRFVVRTYEHQVQKRTGYDEGFIHRKTVRVPGLVKTAETDFVHAPEQTQSLLVKGLENILATASAGELTTELIVDAKPTDPELARRQAEIAKEINDEIAREKRGDFGPYEKW